MWAKIINYFKPNTYTSNIEFMKVRKQQQFELIKQGKRDQRVFTATIEELKNIPDTLITFATRAKHFQYLNAIADVNVERILERPGTVPFSVKNQLKVKNMIQTCGYAINASQNKTAANSCVVVDLLEEHGMTAYLQSNIPQGLWGIQSNNRIFGTSTNPYNQKFISGGSSGGQAVLVRMCCSAFGVGSDMAGSVRIPASFCGVYSFKPTGSRRLSRRGRLSLTGSQIQVVKDVDPSFGFLTRHVDDLEYLLKLTLGKGLDKDWNVFGQWNQNTYEQGVNKKMTIGYMIDLPELKTAPAIRNALIETINKLQKQGHKLVQLKFDDLSKFRDNINKINATPGIYKTILSKLEGEPIVGHNKQMAILQSLGNWAINLRAKFCKQPQQKKIYENLKSLSLMEFFGVIAETELLKQKFMNAWNEKQIDVLITPVTPFTALLKGTSKYLVNQLTFCCFQNILEMPAGVVPVRLVNNEEAVYSDNSFYGKLMKQSVEQSQGLPVCIQVTAKPYQDQVCLSAMKAISKLIQPIPVPKSFYI